MVSLGHLVTRPRLLGERALCTLHGCITLCPCRRTTQLLVLRGLCVLRSLAFSRRLRATTFCVAGHAALFGVIRTRCCRLTPTIGDATTANPTTDTSALVSAFLSTIPTRRAASRGPAVVSTAISCVTCGVSGDTSTAASSDTPATTARRDLVSGFLRGSNNGVAVPRNAPAGNSKPRAGITLRGSHSRLRRNFCARDLTGMCVGRNGCSGTCRVVGRVGLGDSRGDYCFTSRVQFLRGIVTTGGGWALLGGWERTRVCALLIVVVIVLTILVVNVILVRRDGNNKLTSGLSDNGRILNIEGAASIIRGAA